MAIQMSGYKELGEPNPQSTQPFFFCGVPDYGYPNCRLASERLVLDVQGKI